MSHPVPADVPPPLATDQVPDLERGTLRGRPRRIVRWLLLQALRPFIKLSIIGLDHIPATGSFLFVANHLHNADPILLEIALPRSVHFMAKQELFRNRVLGWLVRRAGAFPVDRGRPDRAAIRHAEALLAAGVPVGMFPEGTRSRTGALQPAFPGAGLIAVRADCAVLPASIIGTERLPGNGKRSPGTPGRRGSRFQRPIVTIQFGEPVALPSSADGKRLTAGRATEVMMQEIVALLPGTYHGVYAATTDAPPPTQPERGVVAIRSR